MSCLIRTRTFKETKKIEYQSLSITMIQDMENNLISIIDQKMDKLNLIIKNCEIYQCNDSILVIDKYDVCPNISIIAKSFNLQLKTINNNSYLISDPLLKELRNFKKDYVLGHNLNLIKNDLVSNQHKQILYQPDETIVEIINNVKTNGYYLMQQQRKRKESYYDTGYTLKYSTWKDSTNIRTKIKAFVEKQQEISKNANSDLQKGTATILKLKAKQLGYIVKETKVDNQIQLTLERLE